jgi:hypothetical protein
MMNWSAFTKKQQQMVVSTLVLAVVQVVLMVHFLGWTKPAAARGGSARKELLELQKKIDDAREVLRREEPIRRELGQSIAKLEVLSAHAPTLSDRYAWSYEYVSRCAKQTSVELDSLEEVMFVGDSKKKVEDPPYEIKVSTRCGYSSLVEFLWRLEKDNPLLRIKAVSIGADHQTPQLQSVRMAIQWPSSVKIERGTP